MNEAACASGAQRPAGATFPDVPPAELCRRHSCLDNFVLTACVAKASDNLARLDELLRTQPLADTVKRSYRSAAAAAAGRCAAAADEGDESRTARRLGRQGALITDGRPPSGRLARDVHGLLENVGTLLRRLETDVHKTWRRIQQLEAASAAVQGHMRVTSEGCSQKLERRIHTVQTEWRREQAALSGERAQARQQAVSMATSIAALQQRAGAIGEYVTHVREEAITVGEGARHDFAQLRELKERVRALARQKRQEARRTAQLRQLLQQQRSEGQIRAMQRVVRRRQLSERLAVSRRDAAASSSALQLLEQQLAAAESAASSRAAQVGASLTELSRLSGTALPPLDGDEPGQSVERLCAAVQDAVTQAVQRLGAARSRQLQTELDCRDRAIQITQMVAVEQALHEEHEQLEIEIEGVKISKLCSNRQIRKNVNMITTRSIQTRKRIHETVRKWKEAEQLADAVQPEIYDLQGDIKDVQVKLKSVLNKQEPILAKLTALRRQYQEEEDEQQRKIDFAKGEVAYQSQVHRQLEAQLSTTQNTLQLQLERYELTLAQRQTLEDTFATRLAVARPRLDALVRENAAALRRLASMSRQRSGADHFIDEHGAAVMTQKVALAFAAQVQESQIFELEQHVQRLTGALEQSRRAEAGYAERLGRLRPRRAALTEQIACLDSELQWRRVSHGAQLERLRHMARLVADWERLRAQQLGVHQHFLRQARHKTDSLGAEYQRGVRLNAELRARYSALVEHWLAARMRTAGRFLPQLTVRADLCGRLQVVRLVRTGVHATDRTLGLRHLYFSGEHERGQARLGQLYSTVRMMRDEIALASEHVVRLFIGLMKGEVPFVRRAELVTDVRESAAQTERGRPQPAGGPQRPQRRRQLVSLVAEVGRAPGAATLPPVSRPADQPLRGIGTLHHTEGSPHDKTPRLPKI
ncbi:hypothetical protein FJT64_026077 [Amphibalanus amphitrite]|uniref:Uncharacterized protein n=1 Tax=Amphibalanus amphitrite TaxID=1232801 RepID=A0A6A4WD54_AMPAM|nr:hypothetical protein FJT64_026077 [Amphibalanus amphitrite]